MTRPSTAQLVERYASSLHATLFDEPGAASALGVWLLLALLAPDSNGEPRAALESHLGTDAEDARTRALALIADPHPAVRAALALWAASHALSEDFEHVALALAPLVPVRAVLGQADVDAWAAAATDGLIPEFPLELAPDTAVVLASAVATRGVWPMPMRVASPDELGGAFAAAGATTLTDAIGLLCDTTHGRVGAHVATTTDGLLVVSVLGDPASSPADLLTAAGEVARLYRGEDSPARRLDLFDLALGHTDLYELVETVEEVMFATFDRAERYQTLLPAWAASSHHDLRHAPGMSEAATVVSSWLRPDFLDRTFTAAQHALARFTRDGFEAGAVAAMMMRASRSPQFTACTVRRLTLRFNRPYVVLAVTTDAPGRPFRVPREWAGLPVFAAWVGEASLDHPDQD